MSDNSSIDTCYGPVKKQVLKRAQRIRLLVCDVDGVMSDGLIYMGNKGEELKAFNVHDGYGIRSLLISGIEVAIITNRSSKLLEDRCQTLGITHLYQGSLNKISAFNALLSKLNLTKPQVAYVGDDLIDAPLMKKSGLSVAVVNAHPLLHPKAHYITRIAGGKGAIREVCDLLLLAQGQLKAAKGLSV